MWRGEDRGAWLPRLSDSWGVEQGLGEAEGGEEEVLDRELRHLETEEEELLTETGYCAALTSPEPEPERRLAPGRSIQRLNKTSSIHRRRGQRLPWQQLSALNLRRLHSRLS